MSSNIVSHNTDDMRTWSNNMGNTGEEYRNLVDELYTLIGDFAGSDDFKGGLATELSENIEAKKGEFLNYETTFHDSEEIVKNRAQHIDNDEAYLQSRINNNNPLN